MPGTFWFDSEAIKKVWFETGRAEKEKGQPPTKEIAPFTTSSVLELLEINSTL